jgi:hypothetical protein
MSPSSARNFSARVARVIDRLPLLDSVASPFDGHIGNRALHAIGQRIVVETHCLQKSVNCTPAQQWWHPVTLTQRTQKRHMDGKIKTGREAFGFRHQLTAERQGLFPFTRREYRIRVFNL